MRLAFFIIALLVMAASHRYVWARLVRDAALPAPWNKVATVAIVLLYVLLMGGFALVRQLQRPLATPLMWVTYSWLGLLFFLVMTLGLSDAAKAITLRVQGSGTIDGHADSSVETHSEGGGGPIGHFLVGAKDPPQLRPKGYQLMPSPEP